MVDFNQYPHFLFAIKSNTSRQDENGNWIATENKNILIGKCREETNGRGSEIQVGGGLFHRFESLIQLPKGSPKVEVGSTIFVSNNKNGSDFRIKGEVLKFDSGQLHSRLWV